MILSTVIYFAFIVLLALAYIVPLLILGDKSKPRVIISAAISCGLLWLLFSFKGINTGADTESYFTLYGAISNDSLLLTEALKNPVHYEVGFLFYMSLIAHTGVPYFIFQAFTYLIISSCLFYTVFKLSKNPSFSIFIFFTFTFYNFFISGLRQSLAISLCLLALAIAISRKRDFLSYLLYFLIVAIACSMHNSAILFAPIIFLINFKMNERRFLILIFITVIFYIFGYQIYNIAMAIASQTNLVYAEGYVAYSGGMGKTPILMLIFTAFAFLLLYPNYATDNLGVKIRDKIRLRDDALCTDRKAETNRYTGVLILMMFIGCWLEFFNRFSSGIGRASMYFTIALIILLPNALESFSNKITRYIFLGIFSVGFIAFLLYYSVLTNIMNFQYEFYF